MRSSSPPPLAIGTGFVWGAAKSDGKRGGETGVVGVALGIVIVVGGEAEDGRELFACDAEDFATKGEERREADEF